MHIGARGAKGHIATTTVCGRRHCRVCTGWRLVTDFGVKVWADKEKTRPRYLKSECHACCVVIERRRLSAPHIREAKRQYDRLRYHERKRERQAMCAWCGEHPRGARTNICSSCDDEAYGWVQLDGGGLVEEFELASFGFDHGMSGISTRSPLGRQLRDDRPKPLALAA